jgi:hypothetical protein
LFFSSNICYQVIVVLQLNYFLGHRNRCTVIFKFFRGGYLGLWDNLGGGPLFLCFMAFLWSNFRSLLRGYKRCPLLTPLPLCVHLCFWGSNLLITFYASFVLRVVASHRRIYFFVIVTLVVRTLSFR